MELHTDDFSLTPRRARGTPVAQRTRGGRAGRHGESTGNLAYQAVEGTDAEEADMAKGKISIASPVGKGLLGHEVGDVVEISVPAGKVPFEILEISRQ